MEKLNFAQRAVIGSMGSGRSLESTLFGGCGNLAGFAPGASLFPAGNSMFGGGGSMFPNGKAAFPPKSAKPKSKGVPSTSRALVKLTE